MDNIPLRAIRENEGSKNLYTFLPNMNSILNYLFSNLSVHQTETLHVL